MQDLSRMESPYWRCCSDVCRIGFVTGGRTGGIQVAASLWRERDVCVVARVPSGSWQPWGQEGQCTGWVPMHFKLLDFGIPLDSEDAHTASNTVASPRLPCVRGLVWCPSSSCVVHAHGVDEHYPRARIAHRRHRRCKEAQSVTGARGPRAAAPTCACARQLARIVVRIGLVGPADLRAVGQLDNEDDASDAWVGSELGAPQRAWPASSRLHAARTLMASTPGARSWISVEWGRMHLERPESLQRQRGGGELVWMELRGRRAGSSH